MALLESDQKNEELKLLGEEWLDALHIINYAGKFTPSPACPLLCPKTISLSLSSGLLQTTDRIISSCT
jgi:hypothetical protein